MSFYKISPIGIVKTPTRGCMKLLKILSNTEHCNLGQYNGSPGNGSLNLIRVFIVGLGPYGPGSVLMLPIA